MNKNRIFKSVISPFSCKQFNNYIDLRSAVNGKSEYGYAFYTIVTTSPITEKEGVKVYTCFEI